jgi:hypothetical protein
MVYSWQYNGRAPFNDIWDWCIQNMKGRFYTNNFETIHFTNEKEYILFLLRWA